MHNLENWDDIENCALEFVTCLKPNMKEFSRMPDFKNEFCEQFEFSLNQRSLEFIRDFHENH